MADPARSDAGEGGDVADQQLLSHDLDLTTVARCVLITGASAPPKGSVMERDQLIDLTRRALKLARDDTTDMAAQQQELARLVGLIQDDPDGFVTGVGDGSIPIQANLTADQWNMIMQYIPVERKAQMEEILGGMF